MFHLLYLQIPQFAQIKQLTFPILVIFRVHISVSVHSKLKEILLLLRKIWQHFFSLLVRRLVRNTIESYFGKIIHYKLYSKKKIPIAELVF